MHRFSPLLCGLAALAALHGHPTHAALTDGSLKMEPITAYNFVVDSNVESPSSVSPQAAHLAVRFTNTGATTLTNVVINIGDHDDMSLTGTPGIFPSKTVSVAGANGYAGTFQLEMVGSTANATRLIPTLAPGESTVQYFFVTYPLKDGDGNSVAGAAPNPLDDLQLDYDFWGSAFDGTNTLRVSKTTTVTMRNEISAMANKIAPNTTAAVPAEYLDAIQATLGWRPSAGVSRVPGAVVSEGIWYNLGNVGAGFDNDLDLVPDRNAWMQPAGLPGGLDTNALRLVKCYGLVIVKLNDGTEQLIPFEDRLYFEKLPANNTGAVGLVWYEYAPLTPGKTMFPAPYQEVASGFDNEKFNGDFGAGIGSISTPPSALQLVKSAPEKAQAGGPVTFTIAATNSGSTAIGMPQYGLPLVIEDPIPAGLSYVEGSATLANSAPPGRGLQVSYSADGGATWLNSDSGIAATINRLRWTLTGGALLPGSSIAVSFAATIPNPPGSFTYENIAVANLGGIGELARDDAQVKVSGINSLGDLVWRDDNRNNSPSSIEPGIAGISLSLYHDVNGDGILDAGDTLYDQTTTDLNGAYRFSELPDAKYLVVIDNLDSDVPVGYCLPSSQPNTKAVELDSAGSNASPVADLNADFPFIPALQIHKTINPTSYGEGDLLTYTLDLENWSLPVPAKGVPTQDVWAGTVIGSRPSAQLDSNAAGAPNNTYARMDFANVADQLTTAGGFNINNPNGTLTKVEAVIQGYLNSTLLDDRLDLIVNGTVAKTFTTAELNAMLGAAKTLVVDITDKVSPATSAGLASLTLSLRTNKTTSPDLMTFWVDGIGLRVTSTGVNSPTGSLSPTSFSYLPLTDTFDANKLSFVSASIPPDVVGAGQLTWNDLSVVHAGTRKSLTVTFRALQPPNSDGDPEPDPTTAFNQIASVGTRFANGLPVNSASADATVTINPRGEIGDRIWWDSNANGVQDSGEPGLANVLVTLSNGASTYTDENGYYLFTGLPDASYTVTVVTSTLPISAANLQRTFDPDGSTRDDISTVSINNSNGLDSDDKSENRDFGYRSALNAVSGSIFQDLNGDATQQAAELDLSGITVTLRNSSNVVIATTTTDARGFYSFGNLANGSYSITVTPPASTTQTLDPDATLNHSTSVSLSGGQYLTNRNFAYQPTGAFSLGDTLYMDYNGNGSQSLGEEGIANVTVNLYRDVNGDGLIDPSSDGLVASTSTNSTGQYGFSNLPTGSYIVLVDSLDPQFPASVQQTQDFDGRADHKAQVSLTASLTTVDFGYQPVGSGSIGDQVFIDANGDGLFQTNENTISGVPVTLYEDSNGNGSIDPQDAIIANTTTDANGQYLFADLAAGRYLVKIDDISAAVPSDSRGSLLVCSTPNTASVLLTAGQSYLLADFPFTAQSAIGDTVFFDNNANGTQDFTEVGISGVTVQLYEGGNLVASTVTDANGPYLFDGLSAGTYEVRVVTSTLPAGTGINSADPDRDGLPASAGGAPAADSIDSDIYLSPGSQYSGADFGYVPGSVIGDKVWLDLNGDGVVDPTERGIPNVEITLSNGMETISLLTDSDGNWSYANLPNGNWTVSVNPASLPAGLSPTYDADGLTAANTTVFTMTSGSVNLAAGNLGLDFGYGLIGSFSIAGTVITGDTGAPGTADHLAERPVAGATVYLYDAAGNLLGATLTNPAGNYSFTNLPSGNYSVVLDSSPPRLASSDLTTNAGNKDADVSSISGSPGGAIRQDLQIGMANVEDVDFAFIEWVMDFGDLPAIYGISDINQDGARHVIPPTGSSLHMGRAPDAEITGNSNASATGDDSISRDDEDGISFDITTWQVGTAAEGKGGSVTINVSGSGWLVGYMDWDNDNDFITPRELVANQAISTGAYVLRFDVPSDIAFNNITSSFLSRWRLFTSRPAMPAFAFAGIAYDGEVEDHLLAKPSLGAISGSVTADINNDDLGDSPLAGVTLALLDSDGNPVLVGGNPVTTTTDASGNYRFDNLPPGNYRVVETDPSGYLSVSPNTVSSVSVTAGNTTSGINFVDEQAGSITGKVEIDTDNDNLPELPLTGVTLTLLDLSGNPVLVGGNPVTTTTDALGNYSFSNLAPGTYGVAETQPSGYLSVLDKDGGNADQIRPIVISAGSTNSGNDFLEEAEIKSILLEKTGVLNAGANAPQADVGDVITYSFTVTNTGNVTLTNVTVTDPLVAVVGSSIASLAPGASNSTAYTASYTLTQADITAGSFTNTASVSGTPPSGPAVTDSDDDTKTLPSAASIALVKTATLVLGSNGTLEAGDSISYAFAITNTGNVTLTNVTITDPSATLTGSPIASLAPGATNDTAYTGSHIITQPEIDAGSFTNTATVTGTPPSGPAVTDTDSALQPLNASAAIQIVKTGTLDVGADGVPSVGDTVNYTLTVTNTGSKVINSVTITDAKLGLNAFALNGGALNVGESRIHNAPYLLTLTDLQTGSVVNTATTNGNSPSFGPVTDSDTHTLTLPSTPSISLLKSGLINAGPNAPRVDAGDTITYTFLVTNTGNVALTNVLVTDPKVTVLGSAIPSLAAGASNATAFSATYTLTEADIVAGTFTNTATVTGNHGATQVSDTDDDVQSLGKIASIELAKTGVINAGADSRPSVGDSITYQFTVTNTGNVTLSNVRISDAKLTVNGVLSSLAPGASDSSTFTATYLLTQADVDSGVYTNTATVTAKDPSNLDVTDSDDDTQSLPPVPSISLVKTGSLNLGPNNRADAGDIITYSFTVTNTGSVTLNTITLSDPKVTVVGGPIATLAPGASNSSTFSASYTLTQEDVDSGSFTNTASVSGTPPIGPVVTDDDDDERLLPKDPSISLTKTGSLSLGSDGVANVGDKILYSFTVENTGNVTLTNITIEDDKVEILGEPITLIPGQSNSTNFSATYTLTQEDINAGTFTNTAYVTGLDPDSQAVYDNDDDIQSLPPVPRLELKKTSSLDAGFDGLINPGDVITYSFTITNTGNVTLSNVTLSDSKVTLVGGPIPSLAPGASDSSTYSARYILTQADIDAGGVNNTATVSGTPPTGPAVTDEDGDSQPIVIRPSIELRKVGTAHFGSDLKAQRGETISYRFTVMNTGNVTLTNVRLVDPLLSIIGGPIASLAPGEVDSTTFTGLLTLTQAQIDNDPFTNTATVTGTPPSGPDVTDSDSDTKTMPLGGSIDLLKTGSLNLGPNERADAGDTITYQFTVLNNGNATLRNITLSDPQIVVSGGPIASLAPGAFDSTTFSGTYTLTQADIDAGSYTNTASVSGRDPANKVVSDTDPDVQPILPRPSIVLEKTSSLDLGSDGRATPGDLIRYSFKVTNTGNVTLDNVQISDALAGVVLSGGPLNDLAPGASNSSAFSASYALTQADIDRGSVLNTATVTGTPPSGPAVSDDDDALQPLPQDAKLELLKVGTLNTGSNSSADAGDSITYVFTVRNTGNVTLTNIIVSDPKITVVGGPIASLAPGASDNSLTGTYILKAADIGGIFTNTATASGRDPAGNDVRDSDSDSKNLPELASIDLIKTGTLNAGADGIVNAGDSISYAFTVTNTGNVTLTDIVVVDPLIALTGNPIASLAPGGSDSVTITGTYTLNQADIDRGSFTNTASVSGRTPTLNLVTSEDDDEQLLPARPGISLEKTGLVDLTPDGMLNEGDFIHYRFTVRNTGNTTLHQVRVLDPLVEVTGGPISLAPGAEDSTTFTASFRVGRKVLHNESLLNTATATGQDDQGNRPSHSDDHLQPLNLLTLSGKVFLDIANPALNGIDRGTDGDAPVANVEVELWQDVDEDGVFNPIVDTFLVSMPTQSGGGYSFRNLPSGKYLMRQRGYPGANDLSDVDGGVPTVVAALLGNSDLEDQDFLLEDLPIYAISGRVTDDQPKRTPLPGVKIELFNSSNDKVGEAYTDASGNYSFPGVPNGLYRVVETNPPGITTDRDVDDTTGSVSTPNEIFVLVNNAEVTGRDFFDGTDQRVVTTYCRATLTLDVANGINEGIWTIVSMSNGRHGTATWLGSGANIRYTPRRDFYSSVEDEIVVTLRDSITGAIITRSIRVRSFQTIAGNFEGSLTDGPANNYTHGKVQLTLTRDAGVSARILMRNHSFSVAGPLSGKLELQKTARLTGGGSASVSLQYNDIQDVWSVQIVQGSTTYYALLERSLTGGTDRQGNHTMVLRGIDSTVFGYATLVVGRNGLVNASGEMIWGGTWTASGALRARDLTVMLFKTYSGPQTMRLSLGIETSIGLSNGSGFAGWFYRDSRVGAGAERGPNVLTVEVNRYARNRADPSIFNPFFNPGIGLIQYNSTSSDNFIQTLAESTATSLTQKGSSGLNSFEIRLDPATGRWNGRVILGPRVVPVRGVQMQGSNLATGIGLVLDADQFWWIYGLPPG